MIDKSLDIVGQLVPMVVEQTNKGEIGRAHV